MTIKEIQQTIAAELNADETLTQGGCKAFAEDTQSIAFDIEKALNDGGVALVVVTPEVRISGSGVTGGIPVEMTVEIQCAERPAINREVRGHMTALDAAEKVAQILHGEALEFSGIRQLADPQKRIVTASASFNFDTILTKE